MKEITLPISSLFDFIHDKYNISFQNDQFVDAPFKIELRDENDNWVTASKLIKKMAPLYEIEFSDDSKLQCADDHLICVSSKERAIRFAKDFKPGDDFAYSDITVKSNKLVSESEEVYGVQIESPTHLYQTSDGLIHHNTYTVRQVLEKEVQNSPTKAKLTYESGDIGTAIGNVVFFFYNHRDNEIICLDDNDGMIMHGLEQKVMNIMKAILDPTAITKPVTVSKSIAGYITNHYMESGTVIEINRDRLREGRLVVNVNGKEAVNEFISIREANDLYDRIIPSTQPQENNTNRKRFLNSNILSRRLIEAEDDFGDEEDWIDEDLDLSPPSKKKNKKQQKTKHEEMDDTDMDTGSDGMPERFIFNSSVIFISNLKMNQINSAVIDRAILAGISLTFDEFLEKLSTVMGGLCEAREYANIDKTLLDWAKKSVYGLLSIVVDARKSQTALFGQPVIIARKMTFRMVEEFVTGFLQHAWFYIEKKKGGDEVSQLVNSQKLRDETALAIESVMIRRIILPWLRTEVSKK